MRKATRISLALGTSAALLSLAALPASAVEGEPAPAPAPAPTVASATIEVEGGELSISVAQDVAADELLTPGTEAVIAIPELTVTDTRAGIEGWTVGVALSKFTSANAASADAFIPVAKATYSATTSTSLGTATVAPGGGVFAEAGAVTALAATGVYGNNSATWAGSLTVPVPDNALAGKYTATLTHSFL